MAGDPNNDPVWREMRFRDARNIPSENEIFVSPGAKKAIGCVVLLFFVTIVLGLALRIAIYG